MPAKAPISARRVVSVPPVDGSEARVAFNVGPAGEILVVSALRKPDYTSEQAGFAIFPKTVPESPQDYVVQILDGGGRELRVPIRAERFNIHDCQLVGDEILLVCVRSHFRGPGDFERNGRVYGRDGMFRREILLGDGTAAVQCTERGEIWASYFDEGVFGDFGWRDPVGAAGVVAWNAAGERVYEYEAPAGVGSIADCYALNVASGDDAWCYYYTDFVLAHIRSHRVVGTWPMPVSGSRAFAVSNNLAVFAGSYDDAQSITLVRFREGGEAQVLGSFSLVDPRGDAVEFGQAIGRGDQLYLVSHETVHVLDVGDVAPAS